MWAARLIAVVLFASSCAAAPEPASSANSPTPASCRLPIWWGDDSGGVHTGFIGVPGGDVSDAGLISIRHQIPFDPVSGQFWGVTYVGKTNTWVGLNDSLLSPDGGEFAFWSYGSNKTTYEVRVLTVATGGERRLYSGSAEFIPIAFDADWIYLIERLDNGDLTLDNLFRLNPTGGGMERVAGSYRHRFPWNWVTVAGGAAWGLELVNDGSQSHNSVIRLDLASLEVTRWFEGPPDTMLYIEGVDIRHRLFVADSRSRLVRIDSPTQIVELPNDAPPVSVMGYQAMPPVMASDSHGAWLAAEGGVRLYPLDSPPVFYAVRPPQEGDVIPAGPCT